ncbi:MAG: LysM domain-containing protein [Desulfobacteraceae bacterium]|jgi:hypothetical protein
MPDDLLSDLYERLKASLKEGKLRLIPDVLSGGRIADFFLEISQGASIALADVEISAHRDGERIQQIGLQGRTRAFGSDMGAVFAFFAKDGTLSSSAVLTGEAVWALPGVAWFGLRSPQIRLAVSDDGLPVRGSLEGQVSIGAEVYLKMDFPARGDTWLFQARFPDDTPRSVSDFFQLAGGIDLKRALPAPLAAAAGIAVTAIDVIYDARAGEIESIGIKAASNHRWALIPGNRLALDGFEVEWLVALPGDLERRALSVTVRGRIGIGGGAIAVAGSVPGFILRGALEPGGAILFADLVGLFYPGDAKPEISGEIRNLSLEVEPGGHPPFSLACDVTGDWPVALGGRVLFTVTGLGFGIEGLADRLNGRIYGAAEVLPGTKDAFSLELTAAYEGDQWAFSGRQTGGEISVVGLLTHFIAPEWEPDFDLKVKNLRIRVETGSGAFAVSGETARPWEPPFLAQIQLSAQVNVSYAKETKPAGPLASDDPAGGYSGRIDARMDFYGIALNLFYDFKPKARSYGIRWRHLQGLVKETDGAWTGSLRLEDFTLGEMIETMVSWATGRRFGLPQPWNLLDRASLDGLELSFDFTRRAVSVTLEIPALELGFARIEKIGLAYLPADEDGRSKKKKPVQIQVSGDFRWPDDRVRDDTLTWDATDPDDAPAPPGAGNRYFDLRLLALGQHVAVRGADLSSVQKAIEGLRELEPPAADQVPVTVCGSPSESVAGVCPCFSPESGWLIAADFGILRIEDGKDPDSDRAGPPGYTLQASVIFNDPDLYGLRLALDGDAAKIFKGLVFEILYRRVTDTVGVYHTELILPDAMRQLDVGAYSVTLPLLTVDIYTNGDFQVDLGFPWNQVFTRSFTIQGFVPPGIPVLGSGGFYFGKLSGTTARQLPQATAPGRFNPVHVFGFGLQVGVGKTIEKGVLRAGFSVTVFGILEGVIARWNPARPGPDSAGGPGQLQGDYYFWLQGTVGIIGRLFGSVDFAVIKADVHLEVRVFAQITYAAYANIPITVVASVDIAVSLKLNMGIFRITLHFSFSARIKETFVIDNPQARQLPPWHRGPSRAPLDLRARHLARLSDLLPAAASGFAADLPELDWRRYHPNPTPTELRSWFVPVLTVSGDPAPEACYVAMIFLETPPPNRKIPTTPAEGPADTAFECLAKEVLRWVIAAAFPGRQGREAVDATAVSKSRLEAIRDRLSDPEAPVPIRPEDAARFMDNQFRLVVSPGTRQGRPDAAVFPMPPELVLELSTGGAPHKRYRFDRFSSLDQGYIRALRDHLDRLSVQVARKMRPNGADDRAAASPREGSPLSMAGFVFADYFLVIARQMLQAALDVLRNLTYPLRPGDTVDAVVAWVAANGGRVLGGDAEDRQGEAAYSAEALFEANARHPLTGGLDLRIDGVSYRVGEGETLAAIANQRFRDNGVSIEALAAANADRPNILNPGAVISWPDRPDHKVTNRDTLAHLADRVFHVPLGDLARSLADRPGVLQTLGRLKLPTLTHTTEAAGTDTLAAIAGRYGVAPQALAQNPANRSIPDLFHGAGEETGLLQLPHLHRLGVGAIIETIQRSLGLQHLSGMVSRYFLHGLRLPTTLPDTGHRIRFMDGIEVPAEWGLYGITGQQFRIPDPRRDRAFQFSLIKDQGPDWVVMDTATDEAALTVTVDATEAARIAAVQAAARAGIRSAASPGPAPMVADPPAVHPLGQIQNWQSAVAVTLPYGPGPADRRHLRICTLPAGLIRLAEDRPGPGPGSGPRFAFEAATYDEATGATDSRSILRYGFGTLIEVGIQKRSGEAEDTPWVYTLTGAGERGIVCLERLLEALREEDRLIAGLTVLYPSDADPSGDDGLRSADTPTFFITKANLTTFTQPPERLLAAVGAGEPHRIRGCLNPVRQFVEWLWENSITRSGGYDLYYREADGNGFPDGIFNDRNGARVHLLVTFRRPEAFADQNRIAAYMNCVLIGDAVDLSASALVARADPLPAIQSAASADSLESVARAHYMTAIQVGADHPDLALVPGAPIDVVGGIYRVTPEPIDPGGRLETIATFFGTTRAAVQTVNPDIPDGPDPLPPGTILRLPRLSTRVAAAVGEAGNVNGRTFSELASFYGCSVADLAWVNRFREGLFAAGGTLNLRGGPRFRTATVPSGVIPVGAMRRIPPEIPEFGPEGGENYGPIYLDHLFTLLSSRIRNTPEFHRQPFGLPMGPAQPPGPDPKPGKLRAVPDPGNSDGAWHYHGAVPFARASRRDGFTPAGDRPEPVRSPYRGVGQILDLEFRWVDIFGNNAPPLESIPPLPAGYTDPLVGLSAWPGVSAGFEAAGGPADRGLRILLGFDPCRYDPESQGRSPDRRIGERDVPAWQANARLDLGVYERILYQLLQIPGRGSGRVAWVLESSLMAQGEAPFSPAQVEGVLAWIGAIRLFLRQRAFTGETRSMPNPPPLALAFPVDGPNGPKLNPAPMFRLTVAIALRRPPLAVHPDLRQTPDILSAVSPIPPLLTPSGTTDCARQNPAAPMTLGAFARRFESVFSGSEGRLTLATGIERRSMGAPDAPMPLWAVRLGSPGAAVSYRIKNPGRPRLLALRPLSSRPESRTGVPIWTFTPGSEAALDFSGNPDRHLDFMGVDLDAWARSFLETVDQLLDSPRGSALALLGARTSPRRNYLEALLRIKGELAGCIARRLIPVFEDSPEMDPKALENARERLRQQVLVRLSNADAVDGVIQFDAEIPVAVQEPGFEPPRIYGTPVSRPGSRSANLSAAKLDLGPGSETPQTLTFLMTAGGPGTGEETDPGGSFITLDLEYRGSHIEHQIQHLPVTDEGYLASSWLGFPASGGAESGGAALSADLGRFKVPLVLRGFPTLPALGEQASVLAPEGTGTLAKDPSQLARLLQWDYAFSYRRDFHHSQDAVEVTIRFHADPPLSLALQSREPDLFAALAQFVTVYPQMEAELDRLCRDALKAGAGAPPVSASEKALLDTAMAMVGRVHSAWQTEDRTPAAAARDPSPLGTEPYAFRISDASADGEYRVRVTGAPPAGVGVPWIEIPETTPRPVSQGADLEYRFIKPDGTSLSAREGRQRAERRIRLPGLGILARQQALTTIRIVRNAELVPGRRSHPRMIYTSPDLRFTAPCRPALMVDTPVNLAAVGDGGEGPAVRSLTGHLAALFDVLFREAPGMVQKIQLEVQYAYRLNPVLPPIRLPLAFLPPIEIRLDTDIREPRGGCGPTAPRPLVCRLGDEIRTWFERGRPTGEGGRIELDLTIMASGGGSALPLLRLRRLWLDLRQIRPALPVNDHRGG